MSSAPPFPAPTRDWENGIETELSGRLTYPEYLQLGTLLSAQRPVSGQHDEMLFIVQHQTSELWMKLLVHELSACQRLLAGDELRPAFKVMARIGHIQQALVQQWSVLSTLTPPEYLKLRPHLGPASGFQSYQYRAIEYLMGNKDARMAAVHRYDPAIHEWLQQILATPSIYDEFLRFLRRRGHDLPDSVVERDWRQPYQASEAVRSVIGRIYRDTDAHFAEYELAEKLVDLEERHQFWRFRHLSTVKRIIGFRRGTGGSSGVPFLQSALSLTFFPELWSVRTGL